MADVRIQRGYQPEAIGRITQLHARYYHAEWHFGLYFEAKVATELSAFLTCYDPERDGIWLATTQGAIEGSIVIDGSHGKDSGAHLRWFIMSDPFRGKGLGRRLLHEAVEFCRTRNYQRIYLWTFEGLHPARHLYESVGFTLTEQRNGASWGTPVTEQCFVRLLDQHDRTLG